MPGIARRYRRYWIVLGLVLGAALASSALLTAESPQAQREAFLAAERALQDTAAAVPDLAALRDYPLYPYLRYQELTRRLVDVPAAEVRDFLREYADSPLARRLRTAWLRQLIQARRWNDYLRDYAPTTDPGYDCWRRQALLQTGQESAALEDFAPVWLSGRSLPSACDPVISVWQARGNPSAAQRWQRFAMAMNERDSNLARFLARDMAPADRALADTWLAVVEQPTLILDANRIPGNDPRSAAILNDGLRRWLLRDAPAAAAALDTLKTRYPHLAANLADTERTLALWLASDYHPTALARLNALPDAVADATVREWRVRVCLRQADWAAVLREIERLPTAERDSPRWRYWRGRALEGLGRNEDAQTAYRALAGLRDYHAFLAADRLDTPYTITSTPLAATDAELDTLLAGSAALRRARELYILGREADADAEWRQASTDFTPAQLQQAALLAHRWGWHAQAIVTLARASAWDDLELRFPLAYRDDVLASASASGIDPAWVYAVIRQESAFRPDARSPAGALGLMQLLPSTGQQIAAELRESSDASTALLQPALNIRYGARYLQRMQAHMQDNPLLATAAYNAGPNKVAQWLPIAAPIAADLWAETIPYRETRAYVQRVMEYLAIYQRQLGTAATAQVLSARMKAVQPPSAQPASVPHAG